jgi:hypothetical protein
MTAVVHLVWGPLGVEPLRAFLRSYHDHDAGAPHELVIVFNGVSGGQVAASPAFDVPDREMFIAELRDTPHRVIELDRPVLDLAAYALVAGRLDDRRLCFLNSHSTILEHGWLAKLERAFDPSEIGLVGATGSWASVHSAVMHSLFLPNGYRGALPAKKVARAQFHEIELERMRMLGESQVSQPDRKSLVSRTLATVKTFRDMPTQLLRFERFPAHHLRTNAFMTDRDVLRRLRFGKIECKMDTYLLENGRNSITRQIQRLGLRALVVARDGSLYEQDQWARSHTFWQRDQEGLMIADNQTRSYTNGGWERRQLLSAFAWGDQADPCPPPIPAVVSSSEQ